MVSTHLSERPKGYTFADCSHKGWSVLDNHTSWIPHKLVVSAARGSSDDDVDQPSTQLCNLPFDVLRSRVSSRRIRGTCRYLGDIVQSASLQELVEIKEQPIRGQSFVRMWVGTVGDANTHTGIRRWRERF